MTEVINDQSGERSSREQEFSQESIEKYVEGCSEVAVALGSATNEILKAGKKPVILIPSRGAIPIFLLAHEILKNLDSDHPLVNQDNNVGYYPGKIFEVISNGRISSSPQSETKIDVILYPFTADVSSETNSEEWLARKLRESCARAFYDLTFKTNQYPEDLSWFYFLMGKMVKNGHDESKINPNAIVEELKNYPGANPNISQVVLIDTVISGRAAQDIILSFAALGHKVTPILAVDSRSGGHFQQPRKAEIERAMSWDYMAGYSPFINFPLITEDKGAALLGLSAINFANFNRPGFFRSIDNRFRSDFLPQSCVWALPPDQQRALYLDTFHDFINLCLKSQNEDLTGDLPSFHNRLWPLISSHGEVSEREVKQLAKVENGVSAKETASHIFSNTLLDKQAADWVREFSNTLFKNVP